MKLAVIYGGGRREGNTRYLTERIIAGMKVDRMEVDAHHILPVIDGRHAAEGFPSVQDDYDGLMRRVMEADILLFATPIYWYSMTAAMKLFIDRWSQTMRDPAFRDFRTKMAEKQAYVVAVGGDSPRTKGLPMIQQFQHIFDFVGLPFASYLIGEANKPGEITTDKQALYQADLWNETFKQILK
ncbi:flavodoxin family protein [Bacillus sp. SB49]|uniref:flavodoxin family protein n=1 Tax=Bacillus sp. SB49 TaxID=1071080 RepID=UPI000410CEE8|nr:flavodoxin family protein [Bacillus sp. SB49]QHT45618.1 flavodoxin family protein [Bacillus sp. SB49]